MASYRIRETFFRPDEPFARESSALPADVYNGLTLLLGRESGDCTFLPLRNMQYQAAIDREEIVFVDAAGGYAHRDGVGGRLIRIAWRPESKPRASLTAPVPCEIVYYFGGLREIQLRLIGETRAALKLVLGRQRDQGASARERRILPFRR